MKLLKFPLLFILMIASCFQSCKNDAPSVSKIELLAQDDVFVRTIEKLVYFSSKQLDTASIKKIFNKNEFTNLEKESVAANLGFTSFLDFESYLVEINNNISYLNDRYDFGSLTRSQVAEITRNLSHQRIFEPISLRADCYEGCASRMTTCVLGVATESVIIHAGCTTLDWNPVGWGCHAAALAWQYYNSVQCDYAFQDCNDGCKEK
jgi:hypothetical protein